MATLKLILDYENNKNIIDKNYKSDEEGIIKIRDLCVFWQISIKLSDFLLNSVNRTVVIFKDNKKNILSI